MSTLAALAEGLVAGPAKVRHALRGLSAEQLRARPVPGKWSILEVVCHLADSDQAWAHRIKRAIAEEKPLLIGYDESRFAREPIMIATPWKNWNSANDGQQRNIVRSLKPDALTRQRSTMERTDEFEEMLQIEIDHVEHHLKFIVEKLRLGLIPEARHQR